MAFLTRDEILKAEPTLPREEVAVPEWGGSVLVWGLSGKDLDAHELSRQIPDPANKGKTITNNINVRAAMCAECVRDESYVRLFTVADIVALGEKSGVALTRIAEAAMRLNGKSTEAVEGITKN